MCASASQRECPIGEKDRPWERHGPQTCRVTEGRADRESLEASHIKYPPPSPPARGNSPRWQRGPEREEVGATTEQLGGVRIWKGRGASHPSTWKAKTDTQGKQSGRELDEKLCQAVFPKEAFKPPRFPSALPTVLLQQKMAPFKMCNKEKRTTYKNRKKKRKNVRKRQMKTLPRRITQINTELICFSLISRKWKPAWSFFGKVLKGELWEFRNDSRR